MINIPYIDVIDIVIDCSLWVKFTMADSEHHKLEIVERGDLEDITTRDATRPALGLGSRAMLERAQKQAGHRMPLLRETSLELLHPEEVVEMVSNNYDSMVLEHRMK